MKSDRRAIVYSSNSYWVYELGLSHGRLSLFDEDGLSIGFWGRGPRRVEAQLDMDLDQAKSFTLIGSSGRLVFNLSGGGQETFGIPRDNRWAEVLRDHLLEEPEDRAVREEEDDADDAYGDAVSTRRRQHLWYGDHRELDWRDRELAEIWGMDSDEYVNNFLEHDRD